MNSNKSHKVFCAGSKRATALLVSLLLLLCVTVGGTLAFLATKTETIANVFDPSKVTTAVEKTDDGICVKNTGDTQAWIRATYVVNWQDSNGKVYGVSAVGDYNIDLNTNAQSDPEGQWIKGSDGYYYWNKPVDPNNYTGVLVVSCSVTGTAPATGYDLHVEVLGSGIQSTPDAAVLQSWSSGVNGITTETKDEVTTRTLTVK